MTNIQSITCLSDLCAVVRATREELRNDLWWRGHAVSDWTLVPGVFRVSGGYNYERTVVRKFMQRAGSRYSDCPPRHDGAAWLFLMQHYGLPTRLLDWSESPLAALYFAVENDVPVPGALVALNPFALNDLQVGQRALLAPSEAEVLPLFLPAFREVEPPKAHAAALLVDEIDPRMLAQLTGLTVHTRPEPLESVSDSATYLRRFEVPPQAKEALRFELWHHGIRRSTLFPDLHNLAVELRLLQFRQA